MATELSTLIEEFLAWFRQDDKKQQEFAYDDTITYDYLASLQEQEFKDFFMNFVREVGRIQSGGQRGIGGFKQELEQHVDDFRTHILQPFQDHFDLDQWLEWVNGFKYWDDGIATIYLNRVDKNRYAIVNDKSVQAYTKMGYLIKKSSLKNKYYGIHEAQKDLMQRFPQIKNFYQADALSQFLIGTDRGAALLDEFSGPTNTREYWLIAPGRGGKFWEECYENGIIVMGGDELGDFTQYNSKGAFEKKIVEIHQPKNRPTNDAKGYYDFAYTMQIGDVLIAKKGRKTFLGYGIVQSDYYYDEEREVYKHVRDVQWMKRGEWKSDSKIVQKTLTDINKYPDYVLKLIALIGIETNPDVDAPKPKKKVDKNYWIFQGKPQIYDIEGALRDGSVKTWKVSAHQDKIKIGDQFMLWQTGPGKGCYALGTVQSEVSPMPDDDAERPYYKKDAPEEDEDRVQISIDFNLADQPVPAHELNLKNFKAGNQGTTFQATEAHYRAIKRHYLINRANIRETAFDEYLRLLQDEKQVIFQGAPGTGKSYLAELFAAYLTDNQPGTFEVIQFHPSYAYEDFIQGFRPTETGGFKLQDGIFMKMARRARQHPQQAHVLMIDEINRGNLAKIFGEIMYLLEYRNKAIRLTYSPDDTFSIPENLYLIGTMNTADRSLAMVDYALRRRFSFIELETDYTIMENLLKAQACPFAETLTANVKKLNERIENDPTLGKGFQIGHSYFISRGKLDATGLEKIWQYAIRPLLQEYFFDKPEVVNDMKAILCKDVC